MSTDRTFTQWLRDCELLAVQRTGVDLDALGDGPSRDSFDAGVSPSEYVYDRMADAGFPEDHGRETAARIAQRAGGNPLRQSVTLAETRDALRTRKLTGRMPKLY